MFEIYVVVRASFIYNLDVQVFVFHDLIFYCAVVTVLAIVFDFAVYVRVLGENLTRKEFLRKRKCFYFRNSHIDEFGLGVIKNVVVTKETVT